MSKRPRPTVLISSAGRRVELLRAFRQTINSLSVAGQQISGRVLATDCSWFSSAFHDADEAFLVPRCNDPAFVPTMIELCTEQQIDLIVPTIDPELPVYAAARDQFAAVGTAVAVSSSDAVAIASDKVHTHDWLVGAGLPTVPQGTVKEVWADPEAWAFPLVVKPRFGSASMGVVVIDDLAGLDRATAAWPKLSGPGADPERDLVVQQMAPGVEYTVDTLVPLNGSSATNSVATVPRRRIEVRAGEVSKGVSVRSPVLIEMAEKVCAALPGAAGPLNIQMFHDAKSGRVSVIEINARFGGGYPLSFAAGADFPRALLEEVHNLPATASLHDWRDGLVMLRYDSAVFVDSAEAPPEVHL